MTSIALYVEGGGDSRDGKASLRGGFDALLASQKLAARVRKMNWKTVMCGGRGVAVNAFVNATTKKTADVVVLIVDAEGPVTDPSPAGRIAHLKRDGWQLGGIDADRVHLMTQCMEAWIVADGEILEAYYEQGFNAKALPARQVLDGEPKNDIFSALAKATKNTRKGSYGKIRHASEILKRLRPDVVAARCTSFQQLTQWLDNTIAGS